MFGLGKRPEPELSLAEKVLKSITDSPEYLIGVLALASLVIGAIVLNLYIFVLVVRRQQEGGRKAARAPPVQYIVQGAPPTADMSPGRSGKSVDFAQPAPGKSPGSGGLRRVGSRSAMDKDLAYTPTVDGHKLLSSQVPTMKEAVEIHEKRNEAIKTQTPLELLNDLKAGNTRFWTGQASRPDFAPAERRALIKGQVPKVAVLGCADSRVPIEIVLDQGPGDVFVSRNAGNLYGDKVGGTIDYAVHHLGIKIVVVMGHQGCGAVKAARLPREAIEKEQPRLRSMLLDMKDGLEYCSATLDHIMDPNARDREAVIANAKAQVKKLKEDPAIAKKVKDGQLIVIAAFYEITSGIVDFIDSDIVAAEASKQAASAAKALPNVSKTPDTRGLMSRLGLGVSQKSMTAAS